MRSILAAGWLIVALLAFWLAYGAGEENAALMRVGMALYALLLTLTLVFAAREWLNTPKQRGEKQG